MFRFQNRMIYFLLTSFQRLVFWDSIKSSPLPPLEAVGSINENAHPKAFVSSLQYIFVRFEWFVINSSLDWVRTFFEHLSFMKQSLWHLLLLEVMPLRRLGVALKLTMLWWGMGKFVKVSFILVSKEARASRVRKVVERDPAWSWLLVDNSSFLNGDVGIMWWFQTSANKYSYQSFGLSPCVLAYWFA
jgi:hypothetical protein